MKLKFVGPYFMITTNPERATRHHSCGTCAHGLTETMLLSNSRDFVWCSIGRKTERRQAAPCSVFKEIWKKL